MFLQIVKIKNFRRLNDFQITLEDSINVIVGENNTGKSSIINAIRLALGGWGATGNDYVWLSKDDFFHLPQKGKFEKNLQIDLIFSKLTDLDKGLFIEALNYNPTHPEKSTVSLHFSATYDEKNGRITTKRWGGDRDGTKAAVDEGAMGFLRWTYLEPLRDAIAALAPGKNSRIEKLINALTQDSDKEAIEKIFKETNDKLLEEPLIKRTQTEVTSHLQTGAFSQATQIKASEYQFERIVRTLRMVLMKEYPGATQDEKNEDFPLETNGLGYNNLIYIAVVLAELKSSVDANLRLLLVEEPEAHLHPQLQVKLTSYLAGITSQQSALEPPIPGEGDAVANPNGIQPVQVILTSHSSVIAAHTKPSLLRIIHEVSPEKIKVGALDVANIDSKKVAAIQRMLDVTKASLCFAKGIIFVEGICEQLLIPEFSKKIGENLEDKGISVIPVCGVDFETLLNFFGTGENQINIPVAIITDSDPKKVTSSGNDWKDTDGRENAIPARDTNGEIIPCDRIATLKTLISSKTNAQLFTSSVTLEYDLAFANKELASLMAKAWEAFYIRKGSAVLNSATMAVKASDEERALFAWREICLSCAMVNKAEFAHELAFLISVEAHMTPPKYLVDAINFVCKK